MAPIPHTITRRADDGGPETLTLGIAGRGLKLRRGDSVTVPLDPEVNASEIRSLEERYDVVAGVEQQPVAPPDPGRDEFLNRRRKRTAPEPIPETEPRAEPENKE